MKNWILFCIASLTLAACSREEPAEPAVEEPAVVEDSTAGRGDKDRCRESNADRGRRRRRRLRG